MPIITALLDALLPRRCPICATRANGFCTDCRDLLPWIMIACEVCGAELHEVGICGACQKNPPNYDHAVIPFRYRAPVSEQIQTLKYHRQLRNVGALGAAIGRRAWHSRIAPQVIIPVPLHPRRLRQRGFNQALEIARQIGKQLDIEVQHRPLARVKYTVPQVGLDARARRNNVRDAFQAVAPIAYSHVALVDDVVTSGSTINAAARALKKAGVERVSVWAAAKV